MNIAVVIATILVAILFLLWILSPYLGGGK